MFRIASSTGRAEHSRRRLKLVDESDFEGTLVLEKLAEIGKIEAFFEAIDSDDFDKAKALMKRADIDAKTIGQVLRRMTEADGSH